MSKLTLKAAPTFKCPVGIPVHGAEPTMVEFTFRHRTRDEFKEWLAIERDDVDAILEMAVGWEFAEPFDRENVAILVQNYNGAPKAVFDKYLVELTQARLGN